MKRFPLLLILLIALCASTACTLGPSDQASGTTSTSPNTEVIQSTALPPTVANAPTPLPSPISDSTSVPIVVPTNESTSSPIRASTASIVEITGENYQEEVLQSSMPVLLHFWAAWSGPSRVIAPSIEAIAQEYAGRVKVGTVNVDDEPQLVDQFGVSTLPTLLLINQGSEQARIDGATSEEAIDQMLDQQLDSNR